MKKIIVYFHGYGSSPQSDKVERLKAVPDSVVYAFAAPADKDKAVDEVSKQIDLMLVDHMNDDEVQLIFVGTSLGAWLAAHLGEKYDCTSILINPCYDPATILPSIGVDKSISDKYNHLPITQKETFIFGSEDELIPNADYIEFLCDRGITEIYVMSGDHRFNGPEFDFVVQYVERL